MGSPIKCETIFAAETFVGTGTSRTMKVGGAVTVQEPFTATELFVLNDLFAAAAVVDMTGTVKLGLKATVEIPADREEGDFILCLEATLEAVTAVSSTETEPGSLEVYGQFRRFPVPGYQLDPMVFTTQFPRNMSLGQTHVLHERVTVSAVPA